jgi:hypothetical protein
MENVCFFNLDAFIFTKKKKEVYGKHAMGKNELHPTN